MHVPKSESTCSRCMVRNRRKDDDFKILEQTYVYAGVQQNVEGYSKIPIEFRNNNRKSGTAFTKGGFIFLVAPLIR